ncbi:hypothetical protein VKT23_005541 [Stygiomarasmius scandens]|uniref:Uncharacterized protein n=1 Tax=Marasmiellus scandens TaxID=2682957 RepID=A0ABR1JSM9_9AGAR
MFCCSLTINPNPNPKASDALRLFLEKATVDVTEGEWFVDVGVEFVSRNRDCLQWMTTGHTRVVRDTLQISEDKAIRITSLGSSKYQRDLASHLTHASGCRITPGLRAQGPFEAVYFQLYTTDKAATYAPHGRYHGKVLQMNKAMGPEQPAQFLDDLQNVYSAASEDIASNARVEVRVPYEHATSVLRNFDYHAIRQSLLAFHCSEWWGFRAYRVLAFKEILTRQASGPSALRVTPEALLLTAACVWLVNALHSRPEDGPASRSLARGVLPVSDADFDEIDHLTLFFEPSRTPTVDDDGETLGPGVPYIPFGCIFLRRLKLEVEVPRMRIGGPFLNKSAIKFFFGMTMEQIKVKYNKVALVPSAVIAQTRVIGNKAHSTATYFAPNAENRRKRSDLASQGHRLPPPPTDDGSDVEKDSDEEKGRKKKKRDDDVIMDDDDDVDTRLDRLWDQFIHDMTIKSPNQSSSTSPSYMKLTLQERQEVTEELYKKKRLSDIFLSCQYKVDRTDTEFSRAFKHLFPPPGKQFPEKLQNYPSCLYWRTWMHLANDSTPETAAAMHKELRKRVLGLFWIPHAGGDKMWQTKTYGAGFSRLPLRTQGPAPRIICRAVPEWEN